MCSATNYVLPLRRTSEVLNPPGRLLRGGSMSTNLPGARPHGPLQETDIDLAWQELMAITELQEFEVPSEGPFETLQYHPMDPVGGYGLAQSHSDPLATAAACELIPTVAYEGTYTDVGPACNRLCTSAEGLYARSGPQLTPKMLPATLNLQPTLMGVMEHMHMAGTSEEHRKTGSSCLSQGPGRYMLRTVNGQALRAHVTDDLESDSGLSLGSSPPLASPDNGMSAVLGYQNTELSLNFSDGEIDGLSEQARRAQIQYTMDYQNQHQPYLYSAHSSYYPTQPDLTRIQHNPIPPVPVTQLTGLASASNDLHVSSSSLPSRGSSNQGLCMKPQGNTSAPAPMSRDERRALALKIPFSIDRIINLPVDDFNELLTQYTLNDSQLALVRDIRRRGKNKVAAQNCRKRKMENIVHLEGELGQLQAQRDHLARERLEFQRSLAFVKCRLTDLYTEVFSHLRDEDGHPYSINDYYLQQTPDGKIYLVPRTTTQGREC